MLERKLTITSLISVSLALLPFFDKYSIITDMLIFIGFTLGIIAHTMHTKRTIKWLKSDDKSDKNKEND